MRENEWRLGRGVAKQNLVPKLRRSEEIYCEQISDKQRKEGRGRKRPRRGDERAWKGISPNRAKRPGIGGCRSQTIAVISWLRTNLEGCIGERRNEDGGIRKSYSQKAWEKEERNSAGRKPV